MLSDKLYRNGVRVANALGATRAVPFAVVELALTAGVQPERLKPLSRDDRRYATVKLEG